jgi:hypothetical protein
MTFSQTFYLIRSKTDGQYLVARPRMKASADVPPPAETGFLLLFKEHFDALSYLNTHASDVAERFAVESIPRTQIGNLLKRWSFNGVGVVQDPLVPQIEFLIHE